MKWILLTVVIFMTGCDGFTPADEVCDCKTYSDGDQKCYCRKTTSHKDVKDYENRSAELIEETENEIIYDSEESLRTYVWDGE